MSEDSDFLGTVGEAFLSLWLWPLSLADGVPLIIHPGKVNPPIKEDTMCRT